MRTEDEGGMLDRPINSAYSKSDPAFNHPQYSCIMGPLDHIFRYHSFPSLRETGWPQPVMRELLPSNVDTRFPKAMRESPLLRRSPPSKVAVSCPPPPPPTCLEIDANILRASGSRHQEHHLENNSFTELPDGIGNLGSLIDLTTHSTTLTALPGSFGNLA
jgi:hypothetical protein